MLVSRGWYTDGVAHREGGPTYESFYEDGALMSRMWRRNGHLHREDGPALENFAKDQRCAFARYYLNGKCIPKAEHRRRTTLQKLLANHTANRDISL